MCEFGSDSSLKRVEITNFSMSDGSSTPSNWLTICIEGTNPALCAELLQDLLDDAKIPADVLFFGGYPGFILSRFPIQRD